MSDYSEDGFGKNLSPLEGSMRSAKKWIQWPRPQDSVLWVTITLPGITLILFDIHASFHPELDIERVLLGAVLLLAWLLTLGIRALLALWHDLPKNITSLILSLVVCICMASFLRWLPVGDSIHLAANYREYEAKIKASPGKRLSINWEWQAGLLDPALSECLSMIRVISFPWKIRYKTPNCEQDQKNTLGTG